MAFVNKMDIMGADFYNVIDMMKDRLGCTPVPLELPIGSEQDYVGNIDLLNMKALIYKDDVGKVIEEQEIPADMLEKAEEYRTNILESVAELDEDLMEKYLGGEELTIDEIKAAIRKGCISCEIVPVFCGSAYRNKGVQALLDGVVDYMPAPTDIPSIKGTDPKTGEEVERTFFRFRAFCGSRFQDYERPLRWKACFLQSLLRYS